jgi:hypothetical protein
LRRNGDFQESPLLATVRRIHRVFSSMQIPYAVIGGMAVLKNGAARTTIDVDILVDKDCWNRLREIPPEEYDFQTDFAVDLSTGIEIDVLFPGDEWEMVISMPEPEEIREYDEGLEAYFIDLLHLLEMKTAVFIKKRDEDGLEIAAKDLADIVALTEKNAAQIGPEFLDRMQKEVRDEYKRIAEKVLGRGV